MTIEVTGCHNCHFRTVDNDWCNQLEVFVSDERFEEIIHPSCPLKQETITIKLKENDTTGVCKEGE